MQGVVALIADILAAEMQAAEASNNEDAADPQDANDGISYPSGWGEDWTDADVSFFEVPALPKVRNKLFVYGDVFEARLRAYLEKLAWNDNPDATPDPGSYVSWAELALDYIIATKTRLPNPVQAVSRIRLQGL